MAAPKQAPDTVEVRAVEVNGLGMTYQIELATGRTIAWESKLDVTCSKEDLDELLDRVYDASERAQARATITAKREKVVILKVRLNLQEQLLIQTESLQDARWETSRRQGPARRTEAQKSQLDQIRTTIASMRADIPVAEWEVARLEAIIAGREPPELPIKLLQAAMDHQPVVARPHMAQAAE